MNNFLFELATRSLILASIGLALRFALLRSSAHARANILALTMGALALLPIALIALPRMAITVAKQEIYDLPSTPTAGFIAPEPQATFPWMIIWVAVGALMIAQVLTSLIQFKKLERGFLPASTSLTERVKQLAVRARGVFFCPAGEPPMTWGLLQPKIALPTESEGWIEPQLRSVVLHEDAHIRRRDWAVMIGFRVITALYWFNPLVWVLKMLFEQDSERAADDFVLAQGIDAPEYAGRLVEVAKTLQNRQSRVPAITMARSNRLNGRVTAILSSQTKRGILRGWTRLAVLGALAIGAISAGMIMPVVKQVRLTSNISNEPKVSNWQDSFDGTVDFKAQDEVSNDRDVILMDKKEVKKPAPPITPKNPNVKSSQVSESIDDVADVEFDPEITIDEKSISKSVNQGLAEAHEALKNISNEDYQRDLKEAKKSESKAQRDRDKQIDRAKRATQDDIKREVQDSLKEANREIANASKESEKEFRNAMSEIDKSDIPESAKKIAKQSIQMSKEVVTGLLDGFLKGKKNPTSKPPKPKSKDEDQP